LSRYTLNQWLNDSAPRASTAMPASARIVIDGEGARNRGVGSLAQRILDLRIAGFFLGARLGYAGRARRDSTRAGTSSERSNAKLN
jgi:hypothetical protein